MPTEGVWLAPLLGDSAQPAAQFTGDAKTAVWLPNERIAKAWAEYGKDGNVSDATPPPPPTAVRVNGAGELTWDATADLESGLAGFIVERDGAELARVPPKPTGAIGRAIFQNNGYSDTPTPPLAEMRFKDASAKPGETHAYRVSAVNGVGLKSAPAATAP